ncbi:transaldolase Nqm1p [Trichomonascus vanleenenianus]|uniref:transaldolase Nqm1p n=1 Tax=Trichomonascus vanleenenianus TaxID=2268995 RepID=UPI003ECAADBD
MATALEYIRSQGTGISCDTMDVTIAENYLGRKYINCTSNQAICLGELQRVGNEDIIRKAAEDVKSRANLGENERINQTVTRAMAMLGVRMSKSIEGCALTQTSPKLVHDMNGTISNARQIIAEYEDLGLSRDRIIVKIPSSWECLQAATVLKEEGIKTLGTMVFCLEQAIVAAQVGCVAISPYVNSLQVNLNPTELYKEVTDITQHEGVMISKQIQEYYWAHGVETLNVPAGMIGINEPIALAGVDEMTLPEVLLNGLNQLSDFQQRSVIVKSTKTTPFVPLSEHGFRTNFASNKTAVQNLEFAAKAFGQFEDTLKDLARKAINAM